MASPGVSNHWAQRKSQLSRTTYKEPSISPDSIARILRRFKTLVVVGLSPKPSRPSHGVAAYMRSHGYHVIPVNPNVDSIFHETCYASLEEIPGPVEVVVIFRKPEFVPEIVDDAIRKGAKVIWMQEGIRHEEAARRARQAGLEVVQDRCILKEHAKRFVADGI
ncbi:MAG TPA: CoA-binding protein [Terriglobia bacterium]|nr:CoA-binding protein [Terriglobia bacterium]